MEQQLFDQLLTLTRTAAWPFAAIVAVLVFRRPLGRLFERLTGLKISAGSVQIEAALRPHLPPQTLAGLGTQDRQAAMIPHVREVTILHVSTRGSTLRGGAGPHDVGQYLHHYLTTVTDVVFRFDGTLDRYHGASATAYWGAPVARDDHAALACRAALALTKEVDALSPEIEALGLPPLYSNLSLTSARVVAGNLGSAQRLDYTIFGDYESALESVARMNGNYRTNILLTEQTHALVGDEFDTALLGEAMHVKGQADPVNIYELRGPSSRSS